MTKPTILFFGSFLQYSTSILKTLCQSDQVEIVGVVTTPPKPAGRKQELTKTDVHLYAESAGLPVFTPEKLYDKSLAAISSTLHTTYNILTPNLIVTAGYGKILPSSWLSYPKISALNIHFSLLPKYRGAMPAEWAILMGEKETGVTLMEMDQKLDTGNIISQASIPITPTDTRESIYEQLYPLGADLFLASINPYLTRKNQNYNEKSRGCKISQPPRLDNLATSGKFEFSLCLPPQSQPKSPTPYARLLSKEDSFIPWPVLQKATIGEKIEISELPPFYQELLRLPYIQNTNPYILIDRAIRALYGWPGVWTIVKTNKGEKRLKILSAHLDETDKTRRYPQDAKSIILDFVHLEGLPHPTPYNQIKNQFVFA